MKSVITPPNLIPNPQDLCSSSEHKLYVIFNILFIQLIFFYEIHELYERLWWVRNKDISFEFLN